MESITEKTLKQIKQIEKVSLSPNAKYSSTNTNTKKFDVKVKVDTSDEANMGNGQNENENIFSAFNRQADVSSLTVDVQIDEDIDEDSSDAIAEDGSDTVYGQGTNPKPEDETYLNLLKKTAPSDKKIKVTIKK